MSIEIRPEAQVAITQKCVACDGQGTTGMRSWCRNCGHEYTREDWEATHKRDDQARAAGEEMADTQLCGCEWRYIHEEDIYCAECEGTGTQHLSVTLADLARVFMSQLPTAVRRATGARTI